MLYSTSDFVYFGKTQINLVFLSICTTFAPMKILITGASGFIGSFIVEEALRRGWETWAAVRGSSKRDFLQDERIHFIELNLSNQEHSWRSS